MNYESEDAELQSTSAAASVYEAFSAHLVQAQAGNLSLLDEEDGLLTRWSNICEERLSSLSVDLNQQEVDSWTLERNTWQLVQALYALSCIPLSSLLLQPNRLPDSHSERLSPSRREDSPTPTTASSINPYLPPISVAQQLIESSKELGELSAIRDWLHSIPTSLNPAEIRRGYLPYTKNKLKQARRTGAEEAGGPRGLVKELDPDSVLRDGGRLEGDDASYERALLRSLFEYVRSGSLDLAIDMCRQSDQSWRAASLSGGKLWWDPVLSQGQEVEEMMEIELGGGEFGLREKRARGNLNRKAWKLVCRKLANAAALDPYERALYGSISGDTSSVLPVCSSWEDHVWAHLNALFESHIEYGLSTSPNGRFWSSPQRSLNPSQKSKSSLPISEDSLIGSAGRGTPIKVELEGIFDKLLRGELANEAKNPFRVSQSFLIVGKVKELFENFVERLEIAAGEMEPETLAHLLRFFTHLILVLRLLDQPLPEYAGNRVLEAYLSVLEANNQDESLIAFYASHLNSESATESYARFLLTFGPDTDRASRQVALSQTREHGLDLAKIACRTVELILADIHEELPEIMNNQSPFNAHARVDAHQLELIRSLEWLTFDSSTYAEALTQANALVRYFLSSDKPHAARELLFQLPKEVLPTTAASREREQASQVREFLDYNLYFECLERQERWSEVWVRKPRNGASKLDLASFRDGVASLVDDFHRSATELLESDWLKLDSLQADLHSHRRSTELSLIRQLLIPHLILLLHETLFSTRDIIPSNLQLALDLANIVADERYQLYREFVGEKGNLMGAYLERVREAALVALGGQGGAFKVVG